VQAAESEDIGAAVITVPAAFELDQCDATRTAAAMAGLNFAPLIQEPSAAAWAYSVRQSVERGFWLVYDFGGGTFDAAVIRVADGEFSTINHAGDNFLGGKLIDWDLVEQLLIPAVRQELGLTAMPRS
jgi:molecular chaperone DnaK